MPTYNLYVNDERMEKAISQAYELGKPLKKHLGDLLNSAIDNA